MPHLTVDEVTRLKTGKANADEYRRGIRHLLAGCRRCALTVGALAVAQQLSDESSTADYDQVLDLFERRLKALLEKD